MYGFFPDFKDVYSHTNTGYLTLLQVGGELALVVRAPPSVLPWTAQVMHSVSLRKGLEK